MSPFSLIFPRFLGILIEKSIDKEYSVVDAYRIVTKGMECANVTIQSNHFSKILSSLLLYLYPIH